MFLSFKHSSITFVSIWKALHVDCCRHVTYGLMSKGRPHGIEYAREQTEKITFLFTDTHFRCSQCQHLSIYDSNGWKVFALAVLYIIQLLRHFYCFFHTFRTFYKKWACHFEEFLPEILAVLYHPFRWLKQKSHS